MFTQNEELLPELDRLLKAISQTCPAGAVSAGKMLAVLCRPWLQHIRSGRPFHTSLLTPGGYPLEFAFGPDSSEISYTVEPGAPQSSVVDKWRFVHEIAHGVGQIHPHPHPLLPELVAQTSQRFGCWLSVRHRGDIPSLKVYQEVTPQAGESVLRHLKCEVPDLEVVTELRPMLLGVGSAASGLVEYYCKINAPNPGVLHKLFAAAGAARHLPCVIDHLAYLAAEQSSKLWDRLDVGMSYSVSSTTRPTVTLFADASQLFPTDRKARTRMLGLARQTNVQMPVYDRITSQFEKVVPREMVHGLVALKVSESGMIRCGVGLQPF